MSGRIVIVGAGHAGTQGALSLRQAGFDGEVVLLGDETALPYQRPPLSKKYLTGDATLATIALRGPDWYAERAIDLRTGTAAVAIDLDARRVRLADGAALAWDQLLLATGSRLRRLPVAGADLPGVHYLRTVPESDALGASLRAAQRLAVVGGGYIGLEVAASARALGIAQVTVVERASRLLSRVASAEMSGAMARLHERHGVELALGAGVTSFVERAGRAGGVVLADGRVIEADVVLVGIGVEPETALAEEAGLRVDDGVVVDEYCQTSNPCVYAAGDCTSHPNRFVGHRVRLESVPNATQQARTAAAAMTGSLQPHAEAPWFWSEQYDLRLQIAGLLERRDETILRGDPASDAFALFHLLDGRITCVEALNRVQEFMLARRLIEAQVTVDDSLADERQPFKVIAERLLGGAA